jgi:NADPH:quinone reductase-like Zn-dependent oxidoreductase
MRGSPYISRLQAGLRKPKDRVLGADVAGQVEAVGKHVTKFQPGDEVFGSLFGHGLGAFAQYVSASDDLLELKPANLSFEQAAAVPVAALTALQGLSDHGLIEPGHKVLIIGASGGVGTFAVQIAKSFRRRGDRRVQHEERGHGPIDRRRPRHRLHPRGLHPG